MFFQTFKIRLFLLTWATECETENVIANVRSTLNIIVYSMLIKN